MRFLIIIEQAEDSLSAYAPDLPGCVTTGATRDEVIANMREAIELHVRGMRDDGEATPASNSEPAYVEVALRSSLAAGD
jgi:predicted RNase H-like HicB family nuclease